MVIQQAGEFKMHKENINLDINTETISRIILDACEFQAKEEAACSEKISDSEYEHDPLQILAAHKDDLTFTEAKKIVEELAIS